MLGRSDEGGEAMRVQVKIGFETFDTEMEVLPEIGEEVVIMAGAADASKRGTVKERTWIVRDGKGAVRLDC
jgi:hypothetical protein